MQFSRFPATPAGWTISSYLISFLLVGHAGCSSFSPGGILFSSPGGNPFGFLINTDRTGDVLGGIRLPDGRSVFAYGTFQPNGNIGEITAAVLREADGKESAVLFEGGRIRKARGADGSTLDVTYDEVSLERLRGSLTIYFAPIDETHTIAFDVDLGEALADLARRVADLTGLDISTAEPPANPEGGSGGRGIMPDAAIPSPLKLANQSQLLIIAFLPFYQYAFASVGLVLVQCMAAMVQVLVQVLVGVVVALTRTIIVAVCTPFILVGEIMRLAVNQAVFIINLSIDIDPAIVIIPRRPHF